MIELIYSFLKVVYNIAKVFCGPTMDKVTGRLKSKVKEKAPTEIMEKAKTVAKDKNWDKATGQIAKEGMKKGGAEIKKKATAHIIKVEEAAS